MKSETWEVVMYRNGQRVGAVSGMGKNRGTLDSAHSRSAAFHYARICRRDEKDNSVTYKAEQA
jgi:hypothetical protein